MVETTRRKLLTLSALMPFAGAVSAFGAAEKTRAADSGGSRRAFSAPVSGREKVRRRYLPNVPLVTHEGKKVLFYDDLIKNRIVTVNFFFSHCDEICPLVTRNLVKVQRILGDRVGRSIHMYTVTLTPEEDTPKVLSEFREANGIKAGWTFLTGKPADIEFLRKSLGFTYADPKVDQDKTQHIGNVRYGNEPLALWAACPGQAKPEWIAESISWVDRKNVKGRG